MKELVKGEVIDKNDKMCKKKKKIESHFLRWFRVLESVIKRFLDQ